MGCTGSAFSDGSTGVAAVPDGAGALSDCGLALDPEGAPGAWAGLGVMAGEVAGGWVAGAALVGAAFGAGVLVWVLGTGVSGTPEPDLGVAGLVCAHTSMVESRTNGTVSNGERFIRT